MAVDPSQLAPAPPGMPGVPGAPGTPAPPGAPQAPNPTTDPQALMEIIATILDQGRQQFTQQQSDALGVAVSSLLAQQGNPAGEAATTLPGSPTPPPMAGTDQTGANMGPGTGY